jgi:hypothetical protein
LIARKAVHRDFAASRIRGAEDAGIDPVPAASATARGSSRFPALVFTAVDEIHRLAEEAIDRMKTSAAATRVILVGGGSVLIHRELKGVCLFQNEHLIHGN